MTMMNRPYKPLLTVSPDDELPARLPEGGFGLALNMDLSNGQMNREHIAAIIKGNRPFLVFIDRRSNLIDPEAMRLLMLCLFSKNYILRSGMPVIAFYHDRESAVEEEKSLFSEYLASRLRLQGWPAAEQWHFTAASFCRQAQGQAKIPLLIQDTDFNEACLENHFFTDFYYVDNYVLFRRPDIAEALRLEQAFCNACNAVLDRNLPLRISLQEYLAANHSAQELNMKNSLLQERLQNAEKTIDIIRTKYKSDYDSLFAWYHNEYEILPLWYKRFGHILKVLMGKRTFRSLFYDNVKKYRN